MSVLSTTPVASAEAPAAGRLRLDLLGPYAVFLIMIAATIPWREKAYFTGGLDPVVAGKAILSLIGIGIAAFLGRRWPVRAVPAAPLLFLGSYLTISVFGGWAAGSLAAAAVVAVRVAMVALVVVLLGRRFDAVALLGCIVAALATFGALGALTGLSLAGTDRLRGLFPPLHPNQLSLTAAVLVLWCLWRVSYGRDAGRHLLAIAVAMGVLIATGSRTALLATAVGSLVLALTIRSLRLRNVVLGLLGLPVVLWLVTQTEAIRQLAVRDQSAADLATLSNRTIAWQSALAPKDSAWLEWFGGGLTLKQIPVTGQWWNQQILDSSWISALVQAGLLGLGVCLVWYAYSLVRAVGSPWPYRTLQIALLVFLGVRGVLESGLFDATPAFLLLAVLVMTTPDREPAYSMSQESVPRS